LLRRLQKKIELKIFVNQFQESLEKNSWAPIAMLWYWGPKFGLYLNCQLFWKRLKSFFLICKNLLTLIGNTHFLNGSCITEKMISGVFKKKNGFKRFCRFCSKIVIYFRDSKIPVISPENFVRNSSGGSNGIVHIL
jgi:hypothetical protein